MTEDKDIQSVHLTLSGRGTRGQGLRIESQEVSLYPSLFVIEEFEGLFHRNKERVPVYVRLNSEGRVPGRRRGVSMGPSMGMGTMSSEGPSEVDGGGKGV